MKLDFLCVIDILSKYAGVVTLKDKKGTTIVNLFKILQTVQKENQAEYGQIKLVNFMRNLLKNGQKIMAQICIQHTVKRNLLLLKDLLER